MSERTAAAILAADDARYAATTAPDTDALERMFTDDFSYTHNAGFTDTKAEYIGRIRSGGVRYSDGHRVAADVRLHGDTGIMTGHMRMMAHVPDQSIQLDNIFLAVWLFEKSVWRLAAWSSTSRAG